jgi:hypothetical protein
MISSQNQTYKPCPEQQLWGDLDESNYLEVGTDKCPRGTYCPRSTFSWKNGIQSDLILGTDNRQGCWINADVTTQSPYTCGDDIYCKNLDLNNSQRGNLVYKCPNATCSLGNCDCGPECIQDPRSKICVPPTELQPTLKPGTLPPPISIEPPGSYEIPTQEPINTPIPAPPLNQCTKAEIAPGSFVCWKRVREIVNGFNQQYIVDCDPSFCGLSVDNSRGISKLAGSNITIYTDNPEPESSGESPVAAPIETIKTKEKDQMLYILAYIFGGISLVFLAYLLYSTFLKGNSKVVPKRRGKRGKRGKRRFG